MNSRILKKLCKRAAKHVETFKHLELVEDGCGDPVNCKKFDRKHKSKLCRLKSADSDYIIPFNKTIFYGCSYGYYEPEWEDAPAYFHLLDAYYNHFTDWDEHGPIYNWKKKPSVSDVFNHFGI